MERLVTDRPAAADVAEDPKFNWDGLRSPLDTTFPLPSTGVVQRVAAGLFAKLQSGGITGRDQHEARFVLDILADWPDLEDDLRTRVFQRLNLYAIVAAHGWLTAIAASAASTSNLESAYSHRESLQYRNRGSSNHNVKHGKGADARLTNEQQLHLQLQLQPRLQPRQPVDADQGASRFFFKNFALT